MDIGSALIIIILFFLIVVPLTRWLYRIDEIADYLRRIANKLDPPPPPSEPPPPPILPKADCDCCHKELFAYQLSEYSGKNVCPACKKFLAKK